MNMEYDINVDVNPPSLQLSSFLPFDFAGQMLTALIQQRYLHPDESGFKNNYGRFTK